ncbi:hypothetical protein IWQ62_004804 [Dispira parvispora]|uniref:Uncharacterized protein n=1 Tax=Dispira parvispora TaxID=1520584 RepID=A0A9W8AL73_9FUNG|nr:hypothetical protein IWQ62_004804 [Dispira parvispora]
MAHFILALISVATCVLATPLYYKIFNGLDGMQYVITNDPDYPCGSIYGTDMKRPVVSDKGYFCTLDGDRPPDALGENLIPRHLNFAYDFLNKGLILMTRKTENPAYLKFVDLAFEQYYQVKADEEDNTKCFPAGHVGVPWLCRKDNYIYATDHPNEPYNPETSFHLFEKARYGYQNGDSYPSPYSRVPADYRRYRSSYYPSLEYGL